MKRANNVYFNNFIYRTKQRGYLELGLVLGKWVEEHIQFMDENGIKSLVHVLDLENLDLWEWLTGQDNPRCNKYKSCVLCYT
ncbi:Succinate dehydrogenase assembly factor 2, mitochondrial [Capsicum annuum]|uniref:Succinate dehydrogenase assembly factor 2, mitochondrial n=1 Tax=Capsicum annuum TaxID=4072 RepID=A0A2G2YL91_CAPAN|nr:Succinate dehydrogenase assembly factor 2, mitochondrial [Capsicum annuum]